MKSFDDLKLKKEMRKIKNERNVESLIDQNFTRLK